MKYILKRVEFDCICELANVMDDYILDNAPTGEYPIVSAYANYEVAKALVEALIMLENPIGAIIELEDYEMSHYDREYVVYLSEDGVTCEKIYHKDGYYNGGGDISFIHEDCNSKLLSHIDSQTICEFGIRSEEDEECDCNECQCACKEETDDKIEYDVKSDDDGYSITVRCNLDADEAMKVIKDMENRMERMNDMFREMDSFRKLLRF